MCTRVDLLDAWSATCGLTRQGLPQFDRIDVRSSRAEIYGAWHGCKRGEVYLASVNQDVSRPNRLRAWVWLNPTGFSYIRWQAISRDGTL